MNSEHNKFNREFKDAIEFSISRLTEDHRKDGVWLGLPSSKTSDGLPADGPRGFGWLDLRCKRSPPGHAKK